jgi:hypothetical protein
VANAAVGSSKLDDLVRVPADPLIVLPDDTVKPIVDAISAAKKPLNICVFLITDSPLIAALACKKTVGSASS